MARSNAEMWPGNGSPIAGEDNPLQFYAEAPLGSDDILCEGSDDDRYRNATDRKKRIEAAAQNFYYGGDPPFLLSAALLGPFDAASGWRNPWARKQRYAEQTEQATVTLVEALQEEVNDAVLQEELDNGREVAQQQSFLATQGSVTADRHPYMEDTALERVELWMDTVDVDPLSRDDFWSSEEAATISPNRRKRKAQSGWLKTSTLKRMRSDTQPLASAETSPTHHELEEPRETEAVASRPNPDESKHPLKIQPAAPRFAPSVAEGTRSAIKARVSQNSASVAGQSVDELGTASAASSAVDMPSPKPMRKTSAANLSLRKTAVKRKGKISRQSAQFGTKRKRRTSDRTLQSSQKPQTAQSTASAATSDALGQTQHDESFIYKPARSVQADVEDVPESGIGHDELLEGSTLLSAKDVAPAEPFGEASSQEANPPPRDDLAVRIAAGSQSLPRRRIVTLKVSPKREKLSEADGAVKQSATVSSPNKLQHTENGSLDSASPESVERSATPAEIEAAHDTVERQDEEEAATLPAKEVVSSDMETFREQMAISHLLVNPPEDPVPASADIVTAVAAVTAPTETADIQEATMLLDQDPRTASQALFTKDRDIMSPVNTATEFLGARAAQSPWQEETSFQRPDVPAVQSNSQGLSTPISMPEELEEGLVAERRVGSPTAGAEQHEIAPPTLAVPSTPERRRSSLPTPDFTLSIKSFRHFRSPSPQRLDVRDISIIKEQLPTTQQLQDALLGNPWQDSSTRKSTKRVSFGPLPGEDGYKTESSSPIPANSSGVSRGAPHFRASSPPPRLLLADLPPGTDKFRKHFAAAASRREPIKRSGSLRQRPAQPLLPSNSQQKCPSPAVNAMAAAISRAEETTGNENFEEVRLPVSVLKHKSTFQTGQPPDEVSAVLDNLDEFFDSTLDVVGDAGLLGGRTSVGSGMGSGGRMTSSTSRSLLFDIGVWD